MGKRPALRIQLAFVLLCLMGVLVLAPLRETPGASSQAAGAPHALALAQPLTFDVTFREGVDGYTGCADTRISEENPTRNFAAEDLYLGMRGRVGSLVRFDVSSIRSDAIVQEATLGLYVYGYGNRPAEASNNAAFVVYRGWNEAEATWQRARTAELWAQPGCNGVPEDRSNTALDSQAVHDRERWYTWNVTSAVQDWVGNADANKGLLLRQTNVDIGGEYFVVSCEDTSTALRPYLRVQYALPTPTPTATSTPTVTDTPTQTLTPTITLTPTPRISWRYLPIMLKTFPRDCSAPVDLFNEEFEAPQLGGWSLSMEEGQKRVWGSVLDLWTAPYADRFPVLWRNDAFVGAGSDWMLETRFSYSNVSAHGTTIAVNSLPYEGQRIPEEQGLPPGFEDILRIHHVIDPVRGIYRFDVSLLSEQIMWRGTPGDTAWHTVRVTFEEGKRYSLFVDGHLIGYAESSARPVSAYVGNPRFPPAGGRWTELHIDYLRVAQCLQWGSF